MWEREMPVVTRRGVLIAGGLAAAGAAAGAVVGVSVVRRVKAPTTADLAAVLDGLLAHHIALTQDATTRFADEYLERFGGNGIARNARLTLGGYFKRQALRRVIPGYRQQDVMRFERALVAMFLKSTDHFRIPPATPARFVAFADPYESGCANPLAILDL